MNIRLSSRLLITLIIPLVLSFSCKKNISTSSLYTPTNADVTATASLNDLQQGLTLYKSNCNSCHNLYSPDDYTPTQWKSIIISMGSRTSMTSAQKLLVSKYVSRGN